MFCALLGPCSVIQIYMYSRSVMHTVQYTDGTHFEFLIYSVQIYILIPLNIQIASKCEELSTVSCRKSFPLDLLVTLFSFVVKFQRNQHSHFFVSKKVRSLRRNKYQ